MAENVMIVDLLRNDITRIAQSGTIDVNCFRLRNMTQFSK